MYDFYHEYYERLSSQLTQSSPISDANILSNIFGNIPFSCDPRGFYPATLRVALHAKCSETRAPPLKDNLSRQGKPPRSDERDEPAITV